MKTLRLILTFYKSFAFVSLLITFTCLALAYGFKEKGIYLIQTFFWFKIFTLALTVYTINSYRKTQFYYYKNLGISKLTLWIPLLVFDFLLFLSLLITITTILHETQPGS